MMENKKFTDDEFEKLLDKRNKTLHMIMESYNERTKDYDLSFYNLDIIENEIYNHLKTKDDEFINKIIEKNDWIKRKRIEEL